MDKIDVLKIIRANDEKFKKHIEKIHQLEEREKKINLNELYKQNEKLKKDKEEDNDNEYPYNIPLQTFHSISSASEESPKKVEKKKDINTVNNNYVLQQICDTDEGEHKEEEDNELEYSKDDDSKEEEEKQPKEEEPQSKIKAFLNKLHSNIKSNTNETNNNDKKEKDKKPKNIDKVLSHYCYTDSDENEEEYNEQAQQGNVNYLGSQYPQIKSLSIEDSEKTVNTATPNFNHSPINSIKITQLNPRKFSTVAKENINQAVLDNMNKKKYTAYTYSTIQKKKDTTKPKKSKNTYYIINIEPTIFEKKVLTKKYKGKTDKVALFQMYQNDWKKKSYLKK